MQPEEKKIDVAADHLHNYPDFKRDFAKGFLLGEQDGVYYFWERGEITTVKEYNVANNISNYFNGSIVSSNGVRFYPPKMVCTAFVQEQTLDAYEEGARTILEADFPFIGDALALSCMSAVEERLEDAGVVNGWSHFLIKLEALAVKNKGKIVQIEGTEHYCFISEESLVIKFATADDKHTFRWVFEKNVIGFKVRKKLLIKLIEREKFR